MTSRMHLPRDHERECERERDPQTNSLPFRPPTFAPLPPPPHQTSLSLQSLPPLLPAMLPTSLPVDRRSMPPISEPTSLPPLPESSPQSITTLGPVLRMPGLWPTTGSNTTPSVSSSKSTIRAVTPEPMEHRRTTPHDSLDTSDQNTDAPVQVARPLGTMSTHSSPRAIPGSNPLSHHGNTGNRRQGVVFSDAAATTTTTGSFDSTSSSPPRRPHSFRPRTLTMDGISPYREHTSPGSSSELRSRVSSFSSAGAAEGHRVAPLLLSSGPLLESLSNHTIAPSRSSETSHTTTAAAASSLAALVSITPTGVIVPATHAPSAPAAAQATSASTKDKKGSSRRLIKRISSRPTSPIISVPPSVDSLPTPIPTKDANKVLMLMRTLCGRMRGEIQYYDADNGGSWRHGICYIEEEKGSLMFDSGDQGLFHTPIIHDLRGCRVSPVQDVGIEPPYLELLNAQDGACVALRPLAPGEFDLWLAALLCWQQLRPTPGVASPTPIKTAGDHPVAATKSPGEPNARIAATKTKEGAIIKVGKVLLWDKGLATSTHAVVKRPSTRDLKSPQSAWRHVSCILQGDGEFKLMTENDVTVLSVIEITQLGRCAIQQLDKSVLDGEFCIAIFPIYAPSATHLSIFRPVYIALESRVAFEVWFALLWAFAVPDIYVLELEHARPVYETVEGNSEEVEATKPEQQQFRLEKSLRVRVTEAKIKARSIADGINANAGNTERQERPGKSDHSNSNTNNDPLVGNYLAEVILDGEVRARTVAKLETKNPFWREDCEFLDLPPALPYLSIILKRLDGNLDSCAHQLQASVGLPKSGNVREVMYGSVDIPLSSLERGKDHEQWLSIYDDRPQVIGTMFVKIYHEELVVLAANRYQPLLDLLQNFGTGLTLQISESMPGSLRRLSEVFLNIFQVSGTIRDWIMSLVEDEIDGVGNTAAMKKMRFNKRLRSSESIESTGEREQFVRDMGRSLQGEANLLFRGNTLLTQALEFHMRRLGNEYLKEVLAEKIYEINELNQDCEVDPSKISPGDDINKHWDRLMQLTNEVWQCITSSPTRFPAELRHILKFIRAVADDRYGGFTRTVAYTSVSGFLFLRFVCPAILNPKLFGLLRDLPQPHAQRTLTLIAKGLQALANLTTIGKKEIWMEPMNRFLAANRQSLKDFIDAICSIPADKASAPAVVTPSYSTPMTIMNRLSPAAREGFPSLPYLIDQPRNIAALVKLWTDHNQASTPVCYIFEGELLEFHNICMDLQARADVCFTYADSLRQAPDAASVAVTEDATADALEKASLADTTNLPYGHVPAWADISEIGSSYATYGTYGGYGGYCGYGSYRARGATGLVPPGSSGSEMDDHWAIGRDRKDRQMSSSSYTSQVVDVSGTIRSLRNGKQARKFLSSIINRRPRATSPDGLSSPGAPGTTRGQDRDWERVWEQEHEMGQADGSQTHGQRKGQEVRDTGREADEAKPDKHDRRENKSGRERKDSDRKRDRELKRQQRERERERGREREAEHKVEGKEKTSRGFSFGEAWGNSSPKDVMVKNKHTT